jgi:predicted acyl esterase
MKYYYTILLGLSTLLFSHVLSAQIIPNGTIDNLDELSKKETVYIPMEDGTLLATDISLPMFRDSVSMEIEINNVFYPIQIIPKNSQFIIYDTTNISPESYSMPLIYTRTPYKKNSEDIGGVIFPFLGYGFVIQDMRGRYDSEGVYFPMFSDSWQKELYHPGISLPMDVTAPSDPRHALKHKDGYDGIFYLNDSLMRYVDIDLDGNEDTIPYSNGNIGMYGASALGNSQYQLLSSIPFTESHPVKCLMPIVASNEHFNTTLFHNGVYRQSLATGWMMGQLDSGLDESLNSTDTSIDNAIHSPSDYGYITKLALATDLIDWFVSDHLGTSPSGAHPTSKLRSDLDASFAPIDSQGNNDPNGTVSRYKNLNQPMYHLSGWYDIFINGQIETFNRTRKENPQLMQKLIIGPWTHQTIGSNEVGDVIYPDNVFDILNFDLDIDPTNFLTDTTIINNLYTSELLYWYRTHLGGEPFFIIPESNDWQVLGTDLVRVPAENYIIPYYEFLNFMAGENDLTGVPVELDDGSTISTLNLNIPAISPSLFNLSEPLTATDTSYFENVKDIRMYISGPENDPSNSNVGNFWFEVDSLPFSRGIDDEKLYFHQNGEVNSTPPSSNEGTLSYIADPNDPVITIGGNNMIPDVPSGTKKSQGSMNLADPNYINYTMDRSDVLQFETDLLTDTMTLIGFPKAGFYAKANTTTHNTAKTDFDVMVRVLDVYPDGREMLVTEGVVNARSRDYALSITERDTNETTILTNVDNDTYYYLEFDLLPLGHTFGKDHKIKFLLSSSNYPKYQSNPHLPNENGEFFRWQPGSGATYDYQGSTLTPQNAEISYAFNPNFPNYISLPNATDLSANLTVEEETTPLKLYPNPSADEVHIILNKPYDGSISIFNSSGVAVKSYESKKYEGQIDLSLGELPSGMYYISLNNWSKVSKVLKR